MSGGVAGQVSGGEGVEGVSTPPGEQNKNDIMSRENKMLIHDLNETSYLYA